MGGIIFLEGFNFYCFLSGILLFGVFKFPFHIMVCSGHQVFEFVLFFFILDFVGFFRIDQVVAFDGQHIQLFYLVFKHVLQFLNMGFIEFVTLKTFFLEQLDLQLETAIHF